MPASDEGGASARSSEPDDPRAARVQFDAFVSYRRLSADIAFVDYLKESLAARGMSVWVDRANIAPVADWSESILHGIQAAKAFIFIITPESVVSEQCQRELEVAVQHHKLIIPLALRDTDRRHLPDSLVRPNWIFFGPGHDTERRLDDLIRALEDDLGWREMHAHLTVRAEEWADAGRDRSFLLRGSPLRSAEEWLSQATQHDKTSPTPRQTEYILASRKASNRIQRTWRTALSAGLVISLALAGLAFTQRQQALHERDMAAADQLDSQSDLLSQTNPAISRLLSIAAWRIYPSSYTRYAMLAAAALPGIAVLAGHTALVDSVAFSPDGKTLASGSGDETVRLWDVATGHQMGSPLTGHTGFVGSVTFSPDGKTLASGSNDGTVRLWDVATGRQIGSPLIGHTSTVDSVAFSPDGKTLASGSADNTIRLWGVADLLDIVPDLCASAGRSLTPAEWEQYVPPGPAYQRVCP